MPVIIPKELPATEILLKENIFVMKESRAQTQDIRPLQIAILNLMPTKITTETQLLRLLSNSPLQIEITLLCTNSYQPKNTPKEHLFSFYKSFNEVKGQKFDGMIITGAPVERLEFEEVEYWKELKEIMAYTINNVFSTLHICWGAQAALYYHYGIPKYLLDQKLFGVFPHAVKNKTNKLVKGFDDIFYIPHSRHTEIRNEDILKVEQLEILVESEKAGPYLLASKNGRFVFATGHAEYDPLTLKTEYERDRALGLPINLPDNYFYNDDPTQEPLVRWRGHANLLFANWLNYYVYQETPYNLSEIR